MSISLPFLTTTVLFSVTVTAFIVLTCRFLRHLTAAQGVSLGIVFAFSLALKYPDTKHPFHGLEYEDCYVYQAASRLMFHGHGSTPSQRSFYTETCSVGSMTNCISTESIYNYIGYPCVLVLAYWLFGYTPLMAHVVSSLAVSLCLIGVFVTAFHLKNDFRFALLCSMIFALVPLLNVYASTTSAEPLSSFAVLTSVISFAAFLNSNTLRNSMIAFAFAVSSVATAILIKRENVILIGVLPLVSFLTVERNGSRHLGRLLIRWCVVVVPVLAFSLFLLHLSQNFVQEASPLNEPLFSIANGIRFFPSFLVSLFRWKWYLAFGVLGIVGIASSVRCMIARPLTAILLSYMAVYAAHYRGYYASAAPSLVLPCEWAVRYSVTLMPFLAVLSGIGCYEAIVPLRGVLRSSNRCVVFGMILLAALFAVSCHYTSTLRAETSVIEQETMLRPVFRTLRVMDDFMPQGSWLLTTQSQLFYIYGRDDLKVYDIAALPRNQGLDADGVLCSNSVLIMDPSDTMTRERDAAQLAVLESKKKRVIYTDPILVLSAIERW